MTYATALLPAGWARRPPERYRDLDPRQADPTVIDRLRAACRAKKMPAYICGPVGTGKSYMAAMVYCLWPGQMVSMMSYHDLVSTAMTADKTGEVCRTTDSGQVIEMSRQAWWAWIGSLSLLVLDEVGSGSSNAWRSEILCHVLELRHQKPLILTANLSLNDLYVHCGDRVGSRIIEGSIIEMRGGDRRRQGLESRVHRVEVAR